MVNAFRIFFGAKGANPWTMLFCLILAGSLELFSIGAMLPLLSLSGDQKGNSNSMLSDISTWLLENLHIPTEPLYLLIFVATGMILKFGLSFLALSYAGIARAKIATKMRMRMVASLVNARWGYLVNTKSGRIANVISGEADRSGHAYTAAADLIASIFQVAVYVAAGFLISTKLTLISIVLGLITSFLLSWLVTATRDASQKLTDVTSALVSHVNDLFSNLKPIKVMDRQNELSTLANRKIKNLYDAMWRQSVAKYGMRRGSDIILTISLCIGGYIALEYLELKLSDITVLGLVALRGAGAFQQMQSYLQALGEFESAYWNSLRFISEVEGHAESNSGDNLIEIGEGCNFSNVSFAHGKKQVIQDVSFTVKQGSLTVLAGPSGSGKTTIIDLLVGLYSPDSGKISIGKLDLGEINITSWRKKIGYASQELNLLHDTIRQNITLGNKDISDERVWNAIDLAGAGAFVRELENQLESVVGEAGNRLSGGQRQRIGLARALVNEPELLILDEVTSALDPATEKNICQNVAKLAGKLTIIAVTHRPAWLSIADQAILVESGTVKSVAQDSKNLRALYEAKASI